MEPKAWILVHCFYLAFIPNHISSDAFCIQLPCCHKYVSSSLSVSLSLCLSLSLSLSISLSPLECATTLVLGRYPAIRKCRFVSLSRRWMFCA